MREYEVQLGDTPASIASREEMAGCPKCSRDLIAANPHKAIVRHPNGYQTFRELQVGEKLNLPDKWWSKEFDKRPKAYFAALPHHDGVTPGKLGLAGAGVLADYASFDAAAAKVSALAALSDLPFTYAVSEAADAVDASVREAIGGTVAPAVYAAPFAQEARNSTARARQRNQELSAAVHVGDDAVAFQARSDILHDLSNALTSAQLALQAFYGDGEPEVLVDIGPATIDPTPPATLVAVAHAAVAAIEADEAYCAAVARPRSPVNSAVHAFKTAWNTANPGSLVPINTGTYEQATADALKHVLGTAPAACVSGAPLTVPIAPASPPLLATQPQKGLSVGAVFGVGLLSAGVVGGVIYLATREPKARVRRASRRSSEYRYDNNYGDDEDDTFEQEDPT